MTKGEFDACFAAMLEIVAKELQQYAERVRAGRAHDFDFSTYTLEAQAVVHDQLTKDLGYKPE